MPLSPSDRQNNIQIEEGALHFQTLLCIFSCQYSTPFLIFITALLGASEILGSHFQLSMSWLPVTAPNISKHPRMVYLFSFFSMLQVRPSHPNQKS